MCELCFRDHYFIDNGLFFTRNFDNVIATFQHFTFNACLFWLTKSIVSMLFFFRDLLEKEESSNKHFNMIQHHVLYPSLSLNHDLYKKSYLLRQAAITGCDTKKTLLFFCFLLSYFLTEELHFTQKLTFLQLYNS